MAMYRKTVAAIASAAGLAVFAAGEAALEWRFPRSGNCYEGMAFADGTTGVLAWGGGDTLILTVGRADLWDNRGGYKWTAEQSYTNITAAVLAGDEAKLKAMFAKTVPKGEPRNPTMLPLGRVTVQIPGAKITRGGLDPYTGTGYIEFEAGKKTKRAGMAMSKAGGGVFAMKFPEDVRFIASAKAATDFPGLWKQLSALGFKPAAKFDGGFTWDLPADEPVSLAWSARGGELFVRTARGGRPAEYAGDFAAARAESEARWRKFWREGARVKVPDPDLQRAFDYGMYRYGAMTDPDGTPAGLQGPWIADDALPPWSADYHFNINVQECYSPAYRGGHFANLRPLFDMVLSWRATLRENARLFARIENGYSLPHSVSGRGVNIGGFWAGTIDHGSTAWVADMMWRYVKYSGDRKFLEEGAYDFMKGAMNVYRAMMEDKGGALAFPTGPSPEFGGYNMKKAVGRNPSFQLAAAHALARDLKEAAAMLGEPPDPMWTDVEKRLPRYSAGKNGIDIFEGRGLSESHRHHSHMAGLYPFDTVPAGDPAVEATYRTWDARGTRAWTGWCVPWAAVLNVHAGRPEKAVAMLKAWCRHFLDEGYGSHHNSVRDGFTRFRNGRGVMQMDGQCAAATAVMELMVHEVDGKPEFFKGCPAEWKDVSFENVALSDGRRVSGRRTGGKVEISYGPRPGK